MQSRSAALPVALLVVATTGTAGFQIRTYPVAGGGGRPIAMATGDMNGDGIPDVVIANRDGGSVTILLGGKRGTFSQAPGSPFPVGPYPVSLALGDLDGAGRLDVVVACSGDSSIRVLRGDGRGGLSTPSESVVHLKGLPLSFALGDMDRDGRLDLVVGWSTAKLSALSVFTQDAAGGFRAAPEAVCSEYPQRLALVDLDGDGYLDAITTGFPAGGGGFVEEGIPALVSVFTGGPEGGLVLWRDNFIGWSSNPPTLAVGDVNGDRHLDIVTSLDNRLVVLLGDGTGEFSPSPRSPISFELSILVTALADMNRDGQLDVVVGTTVFLGDGAGGFEPAWDPPPAWAARIQPVLVHDFDGDGRPDLLKIDPALDELHLLLGDGHGQLSPQAGSPHRLGIPVRALTTRDVDGDGRIDIVASTGSPGDGYVLRGDGAGGFAPGGTIPEDVTAGVTTATGDLDGDGRSDRVEVDRGNDRILLSLGRSDGTFEPVRSFPLESARVFAVVLADLNGDGRLDIVTAGDGSTVSVLLNDGEWGAVATSLSLVASQGSGDDTVRLSAQVRSPAGTPIGGEVSFRDGGVPLGRSVSPQSQPGTFFMYLPQYAAPGSVHHFTAEFEGPLAKPSVSEPLTFVAERLPCTVGLEKSSTFSMVGDPVVLSSRVDCDVFDSTPASPNGTVTFYDGDVAVGTSTVTASIATLVTPALPAGIRSLLATYSGDDTHKSAQAQAVAHRVTAPRCGDADTLCLLGGRFRAVATWTSPYDGGSHGTGRPTAVTDATGAFWFFSPESLEVALKIVDGRALNGRFWVALGALSDVGYTIQVTDSSTGGVRTYTNPPAHLGSLLDTEAFGDGPGRPETARPRSADSAGPTASGFPASPVSSPTSPTAAAALLNCTSGSLCLQDGEFGVNAYSWRKRAGGRATGSGKAIPLTFESGAFQLASADDIDLVVKILDGRAVNGKWWVFYTGLRDDLYLDLSISHEYFHRYYSITPGKVPVGIDITAF